MDNCYLSNMVSPDEKVRTWQHRLTPLWKRFAGGCHLDRPIADLVEGAGFRMKVLVYAYCVGVFSSRKLVEDIAVRVLAAGNQPNFRTISDFRKDSPEDAGRFVRAGFADCAGGRGHEGGSWMGRR